MQNLTGDDFIARLEKAKGFDRHPVKCQWEITCRCNLKCVMCYTDCFNQPEFIAQELSTKEIFRILDEMRAAGVIEVVFTGGEPMSRADFREIYIHSVQNGFLTSIFTNGTYINRDWIELWKEYRPQGIEISMHSIQAETFDAVTARYGSFERVLKGIRLITENQFPLTLKITGLPHNQNEILKVKEWVRSMPGVIFKFGRYLRTSANGDEGVMRYQLEESVLNEIVAQDQELEQDFERLENQGEASCHEGRTQFHIDAYGNLQLCSKNRRGNYSLRQGSFCEGFYRHLSSFPCVNKKQNELVQITPSDSIGL